MESALARLAASFEASGLTPVPALDARSATATDFRASALAPNAPVLLLNLARRWKACSTWADASGVLVHDALLAAVGGETVVPVELGGGAYGARERCNMMLNEFLGSNRGYLKDFHFYAALPAAAAAAYAVPSIFADDVLNPHLDAEAAASSSFRFLYAGPVGSSTPLHHDVLRSHSWSANVAGHKLWVLVSPRGEGALYGKTGRWGALRTHDLLSRPLQRAVRACIDALGGEGGGGEWDREGDSGDAPPPPVLEELLATPPPTLVLFAVQRPGDVMFVPSGWHHQVLNLGPALTVSINHNWISAGGVALAHATAHLLEELAEVRLRLIDCRKDASDDEWQSLCARMLATDAGLGCADLARALVRRVHVLVEALRSRACARADEVEAAGVPLDALADAVAPGAEETVALPTALTLEGLAHLHDALGALLEGDEWSLRPFKAAVIAAREAAATASGTVS